MIYRIQDVEGRGPWRPGISMRWTEERPPEEYTALLMPFPPTQILKVRREARGHLAYGCRSLEALRRWVRATEYHTLRRLGYEAVELEPDRILLENPVQVVFERERPLYAGAAIVELYPFAFDPSQALG